MNNEDVMSETIIELINKSQVREALFKLKKSYDGSIYVQAQKAVIADVLEALESIPSRGIKVKDLVG